jgi:hypothetical protein
LNGPGVDDGTTLRDVRECGTYDREHGEDVGVERELESLTVDLSDGLGGLALVGGVVDEEVDTAELADGVIDDLDTLGFGRQVTG